MRTANRMVGLVVGALFLLLALIGLVASAGSGLFGPAFFGPGVPLAGIVAINPALALLLGTLGAALLLAAVSSLEAARVVNSWVGVAFLVLGFAGLFLVGPEPNVLALTSTGNAVHFGASAVLLAVGLGANRPARA